MKTHHVKSWSHFFDAIKSGEKKHDIRKTDRDFDVGDTVMLARYDNIRGDYTGERLETVVTYITDHRTPCAFSSAMLPKEYCVLSLEVL